MQRISAWGILVFSAFALADSGFESGFSGPPALHGWIFADENRWRVKDTTTFPARTVGQIELGCTGTLIGPRHVLTAAHCVYDVDEKKWNDELQFAAARNGKLEPFGVADYEVGYVTDAWIKSGKPEQDYGLVILKTPVGNQTGWMGFGYDDAVEQLDVELLGYPEDKPEGTMWRSTCNVAEFEKEAYNYHCDTAGGSSGSGVTAPARQDGARQIFGIHTLGGDTFNSALRLTKKSFEKIQSWKAKHP